MDKDNQERHVFLTDAGMKAGVTTLSLGLVELQTWSSYMHKTSTLRAPMCTLQFWPEDHVTNDTGTLHLVPGILVGAHVL